MDLKAFGKVFAGGGGRDKRANSFQLSVKKNSIWDHDNWRTRFFAPFHSAQNDKKGGGQDTAKNVD
jgi:hypothetical protein